MIWYNILVGFALNPSKPLFVYYSYWFLNADFDSHWRSTIKAMRRTTIIKTFTQPLLEQWCFQFQRSGEWPSLRLDATYSFPRMNNPGFLDHTKVLLVFPGSTLPGKNYILRRLVSGIQLWFGGLIAVECLWDQAHRESESVISIPQSTTWRRIFVISSCEGKIVQISHSFGRFL